MNENLSDHDPIYCIVKTETIEEEKCPPNDSPQPAKPSWKRAT